MKPANGHISHMFNGQTFSSHGARLSFEAHAGYTFHDTVPGHLLAKRRVPKIGVTDTYRAMYDQKYWPQLWDDMLALAERRHSFGNGPAPSRGPMPAFPKENYLWIRTMT